MKAYIAKIWNEVEPIANHGLVALALLSVAAVVVRLMKPMLEPDVYQRVQTCESLFMVCIFCMLACYTSAILGIRMYYSLKAEIIHGKLEAGRESGELKKTVEAEVIQNAAEIN